MKSGISDNDVQLFQTLIREKSGMHLEGSRLDALRSGLYTRMEPMGITSPSQYYAFLRFDSEGQKELEELLSYITVNETYFFRNASHFAALKEQILIESIKENRDGVLKIWSAGCSTGEEPYSIAMAVLDLVQDNSDIKIEILGTDVDKEALDRATKGIYSERALRVTSDWYRSRYFTRINGKFMIDDSLKDIARFEYFNLMEKPYPRPSCGNWDIIFCRNVVIYFSRESVCHVVSGFHNVLEDNGYLFMGHSETLDGISCDFSPVEISGGFVYVRKPYVDVIAKDGHNEPESVSTRKAQAVELTKVPIFEQFIETKEPETREQDDKIIEQERPKEAEDAQSILYKEASQLLANEDLGEALRKIEAYMSLNPEDAQAHLLAGTIYADRGLYDQSVYELDKAIELEPFLTEAHYLLGIVYQRAGQTDKAIEELRKAIYIDKDCVLSYFGLACIYQSKGIKSDATREYSNAVRVLGTLRDDEIIQFSGGLTARILMQTCQKRIEELSD